MGRLRLAASDPAGAARMFFLLHCLIAAGCVGSAVYILDRRVGDGWQFDRQLETFFDCRPVQVAYLACVGSCMAFPIALARADDRENGCVALVRSVSTRGDSGERAGLCLDGDGAGSKLT